MEEPRKEEPRKDEPRPRDPFEGPDPRDVPPPSFDGGRRRRRGGRGRGRVGPGEPPQAREIARYEQRQTQPPRRPGFGRPGGASGGAWRQPWRRGGGTQQQWQDQMRRATSGPPTKVPEVAGEPIAGTHAVLEALRAGRFLRALYVAEERGLRSGPVQEVIAEAQSRRVRVQFLDKLDLSRVAPVENHQGVVGIFEARAGVDLEELLLHLDAVREPSLVLVIDSLQDPQNFGVLLRSAEGAGVHGVVIPRHRQVGITPAVAKTSAGASEHLLVADVVNLRQAVDELKRKGLWVVGTADDGDLYYDEVDYRNPTAIVVGGEGEGIRRLVREGCDQVVRIPMRGKVASLNAAAAGSVILYEALRQRVRGVAPQPRRPLEEQARAAEARAEEPVDPASDDAVGAPPEEPEA